MSTPPSLAREHQELPALLAYWKSLAGLATGILTCLPFGSLAKEALFAPGQEKVTPILAGAFTLLTLVLLYYLFRDWSQSRVKPWSIGLILTGLVLIFVYLGFWFALVSDVDGTKQLLGFTLTDRAGAAIQDKTAASDSPRDLLKCFGYESADRVWKGRTAAKIVLFATFVVGCMCTAGGFFLLTLQNFIRDQAAKVAAGGPEPSTSGPGSPSI